MIRSQKYIYLAILLTLCTVIMLNFKLTPAPMVSADAFYESVENLKEDAFVLVAMDWSPNTYAENKPQTEKLIEHLMRKRVKFGIISLIPDSEPFLWSVPNDVAEYLETEDPSKNLNYGDDWVNFGYQPGSFTVVQGLASSENLIETLRTDANGTPLAELPVMKGIISIKDISMLAEFTGISGAFNTWIQFFQAQGYRPPVIHGCTSITISQAYTYFSSKQIIGLLEGIAGAARYDFILANHFGREQGSEVQTINTGASWAQIAILMLIFIGNICTLWAFIIENTRGLGNKRPLRDGA